jgi:hypothetical protein
MATARAGHSWPDDVNVWFLVFPILRKYPLKPMAEVHTHHVTVPDLCTYTPVSISNRDSNFLSFASFETLTHKI